MMAGEVYTFPENSDFRKRLPMTDTLQSLALVLMGVALVWHTWSHR